MNLQFLQGTYAVCKIAKAAPVDWNQPFVSVTATGEEVSLVCREEDMPADCIAAETGWKAFRIEGQLDFSLVGILAEIARILAEEKISIFAVSTYDTDTIFIKAEHAEQAAAALAKEGYRFI